MGLHQDYGQKNSIVLNLFVTGSLELYSRKVTTFGMRRILAVQTVLKIDLFSPLSELFEET